MANHHTTFHENPISRSRGIWHDTQFSRPPIDGSTISAESRDRQTHMDWPTRCFSLTLKRKKNLTSLKRCTFLRTLKFQKRCYAILGRLREQVNKGINKYNSSIKENYGIQSHCCNNSIQDNCCNNVNRYNCNNAMNGATGRHERVRKVFFACAKA
jgi:hypothetical protein